MPIIDRYIARNFLTGLAVVLLILLPLFSFLTLSEELENAGKGSFTAFDALIVVVYSLPKLVLELLPVSALMGALVGLGAMANHQELVIINAVGYSVRRTARPIAQVVGFLIVVILVLQFTVVPSFETGTARLRSKTTPSTPIATSESESWTRSANQFIRIGEMIGRRALRDVEIFELGDNGQLLELIQARNASILGEGQWLLRNVEVTIFGAAEVAEEHSDRMLWRSFLTEEQTSAFVTPVASMSPLHLFRYIRLLEQNSLDTHRYRVILWQQLSLPVGLLAMSLLGLPFLVGSTRSVPVGQRVAIGGSVGILFYLAEQMMGHLARLYELPPLPAAMGPDVAVLAIALAILYRKNA